MVHAYDVAEARALLESRSDIRAIVCDHYMPGEMGLDFMLEVRDTRPEMIAILLTAQADLGMVITALDEGRLHRFYTKPWDGDEMRRDLRALLALPCDPDAKTRRPGRSRAERPASEGELDRDDGPDEWIVVGADATADTAASGHSRPVGA